MSSCGHRDIHPGVSKIHYGKMNATMALSLQKNGAQKIDKATTTDTPFIVLHVGGF